MSADQGSIIEFTQCTAPVPAEADPLGYTSLFDVLDRAMHASLARVTFGLSPRALLSAQLDWAGGVLFSPGKQAQLVHKAQRKWTRFLAHAQERLWAGDPKCCIEPLPQDLRFRSPQWQRLPYCFWYQGFLLTQQWWHNATTGVSGVSPDNERVVAFAARQWLDLFSPSNFLLTNPVALEKTHTEGGRNLIAGLRHFVEDWQAAVAGRGAVGSETFKVGVNLATTRGNVVFRNRLIELIQYEPIHPKVRREPVLIVPAWIMKYYVLDLSEHNSLVRRLVDRGHTVFMISWKNPDREDRELSLDDYRRLGPMAAFDAIGKIVPGEKIHVTGYCIGGTLLAIAASAMAREADDRIASLTFLAAQVDFEEAGELMLFINEKEIAFLEDLMWEQGFLDSRQMSSAFQMLRSNDLVWSRVVQEYMMGERAPMSDLMAWNMDGTRMPYRMHAQYLEQLFLKNDLSEGRFRVNDEPVSLADIQVPIFVVATETDHVAPWRSVFKWHVLTNTALTFVLCNGGHNAGVVADPADTWRHYLIATHGRHAHYVDADRWLVSAERRNGSWWDAWLDWLAQKSSEDFVPPPEMGIGGCLLGKAPGSYVLMV